MPDYSASNYRKINERLTAKHMDTVGKQTSDISYVTLRFSSISKPAARTEAAPQRNLKLISNLLSP
jgi:hypothetical protein